MTPVVFHGTERESRALIEALMHNCTCSAARDEGRLCPAHAMAVFDQRAVDGLVFVRRCVAHYLRGEWLVDVPGAQDRVAVAAVARRGNTAREAASA